MQAAWTGQLSRPTGCGAMQSTLPAADKRSRSETRDTRRTASTRTTLASNPCAWECATSCLRSGRTPTDVGDHHAGPSNAPRCCRSCEDQSGRRKQHCVWRNVTTTTGTPKSASATCANRFGAEDRAGRHRSRHHARHLHGGDRRLGHRQVRPAEMHPRPARPRRRHHRDRRRRHPRPAAPRAGSRPLAYRHAVPERRAVRQPAGLGKRGLRPARAAQAAPRRRPATRS